MTFINSIKSRWGLLAVIGLFVGGYFFLSSTTEDPIQTRKLAKLAYQEQLKKMDIYPSNSPSIEDVEATPKYDRPDLAFEHDFLMTMDPQTMTVPRERLLDVFRVVDEFKEDPSRYAPGDITLPWVERGPNNVGGRTRALMWDPNVTNKVWGGSVGGGLWYNSDITTAGVNWTNVDDFWSNLAVTTLAYDPSNTQVFYAGTGEGWYNGDAIQGLGIWKSADGGATWSHLASTGNSTFYQVQKIVVHPVSGDVYACTRNGGVQRSQDGGITWATVLNSSDPNSATSRAADIEIGADNTIYVSMGIFSTGDVFRSTTGNSGSWTHLSPGGNGFPTTGVQRIELAVAPSNANVIYALTQSSSTYDAEGIYYSADQGSTWTAMTLPTDGDTGVSPQFTRGQAWYDLIAQVDPNDPNHLYIGGVDLFQSFNGASTWSQVSHWYGGFGFPYVHADQHAIAFKPGSSTECVFGNDGGVAYTANATTTQPTWTIRNEGYNVTQYYACAIHPTANTDFYLAGAQDNGSHRFNTAGVNSIVEVSGGDGVFCHIDQTNPAFQLTAYVYNNYYRSTNSGSSFSFINGENTGRFVNPTDYDNNMDILYGARDATTLRRISGISGTITAGNVTIPSLASTASAITVSPYTTTSSTLFVGTDAGQLLKVTNANATAASVNMDPSALLPNAYISCIEVGVDENELLVVFSNFGVQQVWHTSNGGTTWVNKDGDLPDMPVRWALFNPADRNEVLLATEVGCWSTADISVASPSWVPSSTGLANVRVDMLQMRTSDNQVVAATHGRGLFTGNFFNTVTVNDAGLTSVVEPTGTYCTETVNLTVTLKNYGSATLTSVDILYNIDGGANTTFNWTGTLISGSSTTVNVATLTVAGGVHTFNANTQNPNAVVDEDVNNDATSSSFTTVTGGSSITLTLLTDCWGAETSWDIKDATNNIVYSQAAGTYGNSTTFVENYCLSSGCYTFNIYDTYGDGMYGVQWGCGNNGDYSIIDNLGNVLVQMTALNADFGTGTSHAFCVPVPVLTTFYSVASGNMTDAIWSNTQGGVGTTVTFDCTNDFIIDNGHAVTNNIGNFSVRDLTVSTGGTFDLAAGANVMSICGNLTVDGTFISNDSKVSFDGTAAQTLGGLTNAQFFDVRLNNAAGLTLMSNQSILGALDLQNGAFDVNGNIWTFASNASATGRFLQVQPGASFVGSMTAQNYVSGLALGWRLMGMPISGDLTQWSDDIPTTGFPGSQFPTLTFASILDYDETLILPALLDSGFFAPTAITDVVAPGTGRFVYFNGPLTIDCIGAPTLSTVTLNPTWTNSSTVAFNDGWNLYANAYQATIDWDAAAGWTRTNMDAAMYSWDSDLQQWASYTSGGVGVNGGSRYLAPHQAFWTKANASAPAFAYDMNVVVNQYVQFIRENEVFYPSAISLSVSGNGFNDETAIVVREGATEGLDNAYDGFKLMSANENVPSIFSVISDENGTHESSINSFESLPAGLVIPIHVVAPVTGEYVISVGDYDPNEMGTCLTLIDLFNSTNTSVEPGMSVVINAGPDDNPHRFDLVVESSLQIATTDVSCAGSGDGVAELTVFGDNPVDVNWYDASGTLIFSESQILGNATASNLYGGLYSVEIIDLFLSCGTLTRNFTIAQPQQPSIELLSKVIPQCNASNNGSIVAQLPYDIWNIQVYRNEVLEDSFEFEGSDLLLENLAAGMYEIAIENPCGISHLMVELNDKFALDASFDGPGMVDLSLDNSAAFINTSSGDFDNATWDIDGFTIQSEDIPSYSFTEAGDYTFTLHVSNTVCFDDYTQVVTVIGDVVDVNEVQNILESDFTVWQEGNVIWLQMNEDFADGKVHVELFNNLGQQVINKEFSNQGAKQSLSTERFTKGIYTLRLTNTEGMQLSKNFLLNK